MFLRITSICYSTNLQYNYYDCEGQICEGRSRSKPNPFNITNDPWTELEQTWHTIDWPSRQCRTSKALRFFLLVELIFHLRVVYKWRHGLRGGWGQGLCDGSTKAIVIKSMTMKKWGEGRWKIAWRHLWTTPYPKKWSEKDRSFYSSLLSFDEDFFSPPSLKQIFNDFGGGPTLKTTMAKK